MTKEDVINALELLPIDDDIYHEHLKELQLIGREVSQFKYYKRYDDEIMFYSEEYLLNTDLNELVTKDIENAKRANRPKLSFLSKMITKFSFWKMKWL